MSHDGEMAMQIGVLGQGAWGRTLAGLFEQQGHQVQCWSRTHRTDPASLLRGQTLIICAVAMAGVPSLARQLAPVWPDGLPLLSGTKGIDLEQRLTASQVWQQCLPSLRCAVLSGPNLATELEQGLPAASVLASSNAALAAQLQRELSSDSFRLYTNSDPVGTELAGALKNVMAVAAGICDGLELGTNAKASLLTRGLAEMGRLLVAMGGAPATLYGLAGLGDLLATANSSLSRNYRFGRLMAQGSSAAEARESLQATVEGPMTAKAALALARQHDLSLPICEQVVAFVEGLSAADQILRILMGRELCQEKR